MGIMVQKVGKTATKTVRVVKKPDTQVRKQETKSIFARKGVKNKNLARHKLTWSIDCTHPVEDGIMNIADYEKYLRERIKTEGKTNNFKHWVTLDRTKNRITVTSLLKFHKKYIKYLSKRYLKKNKLRDWLRVVSVDKESYEMRYFQINNDDDDEEEDAD